MSSTLKYISCPVSQLDLLEPIGVQTQVESFKDIEYLPTSANQDGVPITFEIGKDERFTDLSELVIKTVVEIQGENGTALTGKQFTNAESAGTLEKVGVINNLGHSLWEQIVLTINDTKVTESSNNYAYKAMLETLLSYDDADQKSVLRLSCFKKDHGNITAEFPTATHANKGLVERSKYFEGGKKWHWSHVQELICVNNHVTFQINARCYWNSHQINLALYWCQIRMTQSIHWKFIHANVQFEELKLLRPPKLHCKVLSSNTTSPSVIPFAMSKWNQNYWILAPSTLNLTMCFLVMFQTDWLFARWKIDQCMGCLKRIRFISNTMV